jgi:hypothetical protein
VTGGLRNSPAGWQHGGAPEVADHRPGFGALRGGFEPLLGLQHDASSISNSACHSMHCVRERVRLKVHT